MTHYLRSNKKRFGGFFRFIDDVFTLGPHIPDSVYGMSSEDTTRGIDSCVFLGGWFRWQRYKNDDGNEKTRVRMSVYNKESDWVHYDPIKYTGRTSAAPKSQGNGIVISQMIRTARICNNLEDFMVEAELILRRLLIRGWKPYELRVTWQRTVRELFCVAPAQREKIERLFDTATDRHYRKCPMPKLRAYVWSKPNRGMPDKDTEPAEGTERAGKSEDTSHTDPAPQGADVKPTGSANQRKSESDSFVPLFSHLLPFRTDVFLFFFVLSLFSSPLSTRPLTTASSFGEEHDKYEGTAQRYVVVGCCQ